MTEPKYDILRKIGNGEEVYVFDNPTRRENCTSYLRDRLRARWDKCRCIDYREDRYLFILQHDGVYTHWRIVEVELNYV